MSVVFHPNHRCWGTPAHSTHEGTAVREECREERGLSFFLSPRSAFFAELTEGVWEYRKFVTCLLWSRVVSIEFVADMMVSGGVSFCL